MLEIQWGAESETDINAEHCFCAAVAFEWVGGWHVLDMCV